MAGNTRKWFWAAVLAWIVSSSAMFAAKLCASKTAMLAARVSQASHDGTARGDDDAEELASRYLQYFRVFDATSVVFGVLMAAAWVVSHRKGERASHAALVAMLLALCLLYFVMV